MTSKIVVNNIEADSGINTVTFNSNISGNLIGNVTGNVNSTGVTTVTSLRIGTGTSISSPATNVLALGTNNVEVARFDSSGRLGIGTATPTVAGSRNTLTVNGASGADFYLHYNGSEVFSLQAGSSTAVSLNYPSSGTFSINRSGSNVANFDSGGRLVLGTTSSPATAPRLVVQSNPNSSTGQANVYLQRGDNTYTADTVLGTITFTDSSANIFSTIEGQIDAAGGSADYPGRIVFKTVADGGTNPVERLRIDSSGRVLKPYTPHIFGSVTNTTTASNSNANSFTVQTSTELTFSTDRITVPVAGLYLITFCTLSGQDSSRKDANIIVNGTSRLNMLSEDATTGYHYRGGSLVIKLAANDYIQFYNQNWYANTSTAFEAWRTASVTFLG